MQNFTHRIILGGQGGKVKRLGVWQCVCEESLLVVFPRRVENLSFCSYCLEIVLKRSIHETLSAYQPIGLFRAISVGEGHFMSL